MCGVSSSILHRSTRHSKGAKSAPGQVFGRRRCRASHTLMRPASEKRQGTKSRWVWHPAFGTSAMGIWARGRGSGLLIVVIGRPGGKSRADQLELMDGKNEWLGGQLRWSQHRRPASLKVREHCGSRARGCDEGSS